MKQLWDALTVYNKTKNELEDVIRHVLRPGDAISWYLWGRVHVGTVISVSRDNSLRIKVRNNATARSYFVHIHDIAAAYPAPWPQEDQAVG